MKILIGTKEYDIPENEFTKAGSAYIAEPGSNFEKLVIAEWTTLAKPASRVQALAALNGILKDFIGPMQRALVLENFRGEERQFFYDKMVDLAAVIAQMPATYETDGLDPRTVKAQLHYFAGGSANWYLTEKDKGCDPEPGEPRDDRQVQAFGLADLFNDGGERGYISIAEILVNGGELDFYWTPKTLDQIAAERTGDSTFAGPRLMSDAEVEAEREIAKIEGNQP